MKVTEKQIKAILTLDKEKRYTFFIKVIADWEEVWGLYQDGWALAKSDEGEVVFPMWPTKEYAELCAQNEWENYFPKSFTLQDMMEELLPNLKKDGFFVGAFYTPSNKGVVIHTDEFLSSIVAELEKYS